MSCHPGSAPTRAGGDATAPLTLSSYTQPPWSVLRYGAVAAMRTNPYTSHAGACATCDTQSRIAVCTSTTETCQNGRTR